MVEELGEVTVGRLLDQQGLRLAVAESCTGGLVGHRLTNVPGSSNYFLGGVIAYSNAVKLDLLSVDPETLERYGAVSEQVVLEMAYGARLRFMADVGLSVSGIAGPDGGTPEKPVGLVWFGLSAAHIDEATSRIFSGGREEVKQKAAGTALELLAGFIQRLAEEIDRQPQVAGKSFANASWREHETNTRHGMDAIEVTVRFDASGNAIPLKFFWRGQDYQVESTGRRWVDEKGQHILVMIPGGRVFELLHSQDDRRWYLRKIGENRMLV